MSEVNLSALADSDKDRVETKLKTAAQEIDEALKACKFGRFHIRLLCAAFLGLVASIFVTASTGYLLPIAECDLHMTLLQKGILGAIPYLGMLVSSILAGFLTDTFGRKIFLLLGYGGIFVFTIISALAQSYEILVTAKFFEGVLFAASLTPTIIFMSEFCHNGIRDQMMLFQSSFSAMAQIIIAVVSWGILVNDWKYSLLGGSIVLNTWNFYLIFVSLWSLIAFTFYALLPESPKYLITQEKYDEAREVLIKVYRENTGMAADTYPYRHLWAQKSKVFTISEGPEIQTKTSLKHQISLGLSHSKEMFRKPLVMYLALICTMNFLSMLLYNVIRLWFPQLSTIVEHYGDTSADGSRDLCVWLDAYTNDLKERTLNSTGPIDCIPTKSGTETYINVIIMGLVCVLPYPVNGVLVKRVGKKYLLMAACLISTVSTLGLRWANSKPVMVALFSIDTAASQTIISLFQAVMVQIFPTSTRTLAISIVMLLGRIGTLLGNIAFPILLNLGCVIPFFTLTGFMICVTILSVFLPNKK